MSMSIISRASLWISKPSLLLLFLIFKVNSQTYLAVKFRRALYWIITRIKEKLRMLACLKTHN